MRVLIVYTHPNPESYTSAVLQVVEDQVKAAGAEYRILDLYAEGFAPVLGAEELSIYEDLALNQASVKEHCDLVAWCDTLIFVYPTWWYGLPAMLKGWLDRVLVPGLAFQMPAAENDNIKPGLTHIRRLAVYTTCGASWWLTRWIGAPGRRTILRGIRVLCSKQCRTSYAAHYLMDSSTTESRAAHLARVGRAVNRLLKG